MLNPRTGVIGSSSHKKWNITLNRNTPAFLASSLQLKCFWTTLSIVCFLTLSRSSPGTLASDDKAERNQQSPNFFPCLISLASRPSVNMMPEPRRPTGPLAFSFEQISNSLSWNLLSEYYFETRNTAKQTYQNRKLWELGVIDRSNLLSIDD